MRYDLSALARRARNPRRKSVTLRDIVSPATLATNLYLATYARVVRHWSEAVPRIMAQYERTLSAMTTDAPADVQAEITATENGFLRLLLEIAPELTEWVLRTERWYRGKWRGAVLSATGVDLTMLIGPDDVRDTLDVVIARNTALIKDVSAQAQQRISDAVFRGLTQRTPAEDVAKEVREVVAMSKRRSVNIASDQLSKLTSALADERRREAGIEQWEWVHSRKRHPRESHVARNGRVYSDKDRPPTMPGEEPFCGCRQRAVLRFE